jgi:hypothetical protein
MSVSLAKHFSCIDAVAKADTAEGSYEGTARMLSGAKHSQNGRVTQGDDEDDAQYEGEGIVADEEY